MTDRTDNTAALLRSLRLLLKVRNRPGAKHAIRMDIKALRRARAAA